MNKRLGIAEAEVTTARALSDAEKKDLLSVLQRRTGKKIEARFAEDKDLLGGAVVASVPPFTKDQCASN